MKKLGLNLISLLAIVLFFIMATATSEDECFYNMEVERLPDGLIVTNNNDFQYTGLLMSITKTILNDGQGASVIDTSFRFELEGQEVGIGSSKEFLFRDFRSTDNSFPSDTISDFYLEITGSAPEEDFCFFSKVFD